MTSNPYKEYFESMPAYLTIMDRNLRIVEANRRFRRDFGEFEGRYCYQMNQHRSERCEQCPAERTFRDGLRHGIEETVVNKQGNEIILLINTIAVPDESGEITRVMRMATDITELKLLQKQIRDSRERYRKLFDEVPCYISIQDADLRIVGERHRLVAGVGVAQVLGHAEALHWLLVGPACP